MNMHSAFFCLAVLGAFLGVAKSDFTCFAGKLKTLESNIYGFFGENKVTSCRYGMERFMDSLHQAIDQCSVPVKTDSMRSLIEEVCDPNTELSKALVESAECLSLNSLDSMADMMNCKSNRKLDSSLPVEEACLTMKREFFTCAANTIGGRCGARAVNALNRIFKTSDSLTNGICKELASKSSSSVSQPVSQPVNIPEVSQPANIPEVSQPVNIPEVSQSVNIHRRKVDEGYESSSVLGYIHWIAIGVGLFVVFIGIIIYMAKKPAPIKYTHDIV